MRGVVLLSEVHPDTMKFIDPVAQARDWHQLVSAAEAKAWKSRGGVDFKQLMTLVAFRAQQQKKTLLLRDWSHIDYHGIPYTKPTMQPRIVEALAEQFEIVRTATVRHPIDTYLSLMNLAIMHNRPLPVRQYLDGCERFAEEAASIGFIRYEDFTNRPEDTLRTICERLDMPFDATYAERWAANDHVTGDTTGTRGGKSEIRPLERRRADDKIIEAFRAIDSYRRIKVLLGYEDD